MSKRSGYVEVKPQEGVKKTAYYKCSECGFAAAPADVAANRACCPRCGAYYRMRPRKRIQITCDEGTFQGLFSDIEGSDPLEFPGYAEKVQGTQRRFMTSEAVSCGTASIEGQPCAIAVMDAAFMMGSMGSAVGERMAQLFDYATEHELPVVVFTASGGARMQEGLVSLMQMAKVSCAVQRHREAGLLYISVITDPTTGGVTASFATQGDIILSEPKALIGFAGRRVIESTVREALPDDFQTAEFALEHGLIDGIVAREDMRQVISELILLHRKDDAQDFLELMKSHSSRSGRRTQDFLRERIEKNRHAAKERSKEMKARLKLLRRTSKDKEYGLAAAPFIVEEDSDAGVSPEASGSAWDKVRLARRIDRPTAKVYRESLVQGFLQMHGDRCFADDNAIVAGLGFINGRAVTVITQEKGSNTAERIHHNFGCAHPEGYRKAIRLARQAEAFGRPVVCLVDTQGAHCDAASEERGQGNALAECLTTFAGLRVPVVSVILSEGGSGGALALALADRVAMMENAVYSILTPEGFASILWKDASRAAEAAEAMRPTAHDALAMGLIDDVIPEMGEGAHDRTQEAVDALCKYVEDALDELCAMDVDELVAARQQRFAKMGC